MNERQSGFTLIELLAVIVLLAIIAIVVIPKYFSLLDDSRQRMALGLAASAQSQLTMEYARRSVAGESLSVSAQTICDMVSLSTGGQTVSVTCSGSLADATVSITALVDGQPATVTWASPQ